MPYTAIMATEPDGRVAIMADFPTRAEADAHVDKFKASWPDAFVVDTPVEHFSHWSINVAGKSISMVLPTAPVPQSVTKLQLVRALRTAGLWGDVKSALKSSGTVVKEDWEYASQINRYDSLVASFAVAIGLTEADMDAIFVQGAEL